VAAAGTPERPVVKAVWGWFSACLQGNWKWIQCFSAEFWDGAISGLCKQALTCKTKQLSHTLQLQPNPALAVAPQVGDCRA